MTPSKTPPGCTRSSATGSPFAGCAMMAAAAGRNARTTTPPSCGCAPRTECGFACSRRTMRSRSAAVAMDIWDCLPSLGVEQPSDPGHRDPHPVGTVVELVAQLVDGLLELEDGQQL